MIPDQQSNGIFVQLFYGVGPFSQQIQTLNTQPQARTGSTVEHYDHRSQGTQRFKKGKHLKRHMDKLIKFAIKADNGSTSALNLLPGRIPGQKAYQKLMLQIIPRIKGKTNKPVILSKVLHRRRGDNAPMVCVSLYGNEKTEYRKTQIREQKGTNERINLTIYSRKILEEEREQYQNLLEEAIEDESLEDSVKQQKIRFFKNKLLLVNHENWIYSKLKSEPSKLSLLI